MAKKSKVTRSSGNVFADLGLERPQEHKAKALLVIRISKIIEDKKLSQSQAAARMGLRQPDVSKLVRGRFEGFSLERLFYFIRALGSNVEIKVRPTRDNHEGRILVDA
jgi:predicted XRE-type DNA-binding protein